MTDDFRYWPMPEDGQPSGGLLYDDRDDQGVEGGDGLPRFRNLVYHCTGKGSLVIAPIGAVFGFVAHGLTAVRSDNLKPSVPVEEGQYFVCANGAVLDNASQYTRVLAIQQAGYLAIPAVGGPIEAAGRLRYIDLCSDTLLVAPALRGDPCLNHLHFPPSIDQTEHTHPSLRAGVVARGRGECRTPAGTYPLEPGTIFVIPTGSRHAFRTEHKLMDVIAFHPDSDVGPEHEDHPMINRTWVDGEKIDTRSGRHAEGQVISGRFVPTENVD